VRSSAGWRLARAALSTSHRLLIMTASCRKRGPQSALNGALRESEMRFGRPHPLSSVARRRKAGQPRRAVPRRSPATQEPAPQSPDPAHHVAVRRVEFSGPLPSPEVLREYDLIAPGAADRIIKMAESYAAHEQSMERAALHAKVREKRLGQLLGFVLAVAALSTSVMVARLGYPWVSGVLGGSTIVSLVAVFVLGRLPRQNPTTTGR